MFVYFFTAHYQPLTDCAQGTKSFIITKTVPWCIALNAKITYSIWSIEINEGIKQYESVKSISLAVVVGDFNVSYICWMEMQNLFYFDKIFHLFRTEMHGAFCILIKVFYIFGTEMHHFLYFHYFTKITYGH